ncbi:MAG: hypothetical protein RR543_02985 [Erysipelotrichales bacterium]
MKKRNIFMIIILIIVSGCGLNPEAKQFYENHKELFKYDKKEDLVGVQKDMVDILKEHKIDNVNVGIIMDEPGIKEFRSSGTTNSVKSFGYYYVESSVKVKDIKMCNILKKDLEKLPKDSFNFDCSTDKDSDEPITIGIFKEK